MSIMDDALRDLHEAEARFGKHNADDGTEPSNDYTDAVRDYEEYKRRRDSKQKAGEPPHNDAGDAGDGKSPESQATALVRLTAEWHLFHDSDSTAYATLPGASGERQTHRLNSKAVRLALQRAYHHEKSQVPRAQAVQDALGVLAGKAIFDGPTIEVHVRLAAHEGRIYLDLGDETWQVVEITASGWAVRSSAEAAIRFRRPKGLLPLPHPVRGGTIGMLRRFLNVASDDAFYLLVGWLIGAFNRRGPYAILNLHGEQGSAKSTTLRVLRACIDPSSVPLRSQPREERDLLLDAVNSYLVAIDNVSIIPEWLSDGLCRLSTGGGSSARELYTDSEQTLFAAQRPCMTNGIEEYASRQDYLDRSVVVMLPPISEEGRLSERAFWQQFEQARPSILGVLLDAVSHALRDESTVVLDKLPRMADFAIWVTAAEPALGWERGTFMTAYTTNRTEAHDVALDASVLAPPLRAFIDGVGTWEGTAAALLHALNEKVDETTRKQRGWPSKAHTLSGALRRLAPSLRGIGITVEFERTGRKRIIRVEKRTDAQASVTSVTEREEASSGASPAPCEASPEPAERHHAQARNDASDASDAPAPSTPLTPHDAAEGDVEWF